MKNYLKSKLCDFCGHTVPGKNGFAYCVHCGILYNVNYEKTNYEDVYFNDEYKQQYGKSYIDDKENIIKKINQRIALLKKNIPEWGFGNLLEIGSAAGFFLEAVKKEGLTAQGWELSRYMSDYANQNQNKTTCVDFNELIHNKKENSAMLMKEAVYDIIAAFFVIEHFPDQKTIWENLLKMLKPGGYLAITVPSISGPHYVFHKKQWQKDHPKDHYLDFSHKGIKKLCNLFHLKLLLMAPEGIHPGRFPLGGFRPFSFFYRKFQKKFAFSDTIFIIAQKACLSTIK